MTCYTPTAGVEQYLNSILLIILINNILRVRDLIYIANVQIRFYKLFKYLPKI